MLLECNSEECLTARANLATARNEIIRLCEIIASLRAKLASATAMAAIYGAMAAAMMALALALAAIPVVGWLVAAAVAVIGVVFLGLQAIYLVSIASLTRQINDTESELEAARKSFQLAVSEVMKNCPSECWGDLVMPTC
jgi:ABC-type multidrug transport system fused ATPase/permease subunit